MCVGAGGRAVGEGHVCHGESVGAGGDPVEECTEIPAAQPRGSELHHGQVRLRPARVPPRLSGYYNYNL